ncbi:sodium/proline symporter PutP [Tepidimonas alkaliphilus]|nr:sodium/proline symporter PutP [Tepidimonas alkaliphilus]
MRVEAPIVIMFGLYLGGMLLVGWLGWRATRSLSDYILGGRRLGAWVTALAAGASDMSGWLLMGLPGAIFLSGLSEAWIAVGLVAGAYLNWRWVAARLRLYSEHAGNALTLPDYFAQRFGRQGAGLRSVAAVVILLFFTLYAASGVVAAARLFESMFGLPYATALWVGALCTMAYVLIGGFLAVSWTDTIQASLMFGALVLAPVIVMEALGGPAASVAAVAQTHPEHWNVLGKLDAIAIVSLLAWGLGYFGQPHILVRFMAAESASAMGRARRIGMTWMVLCLAGAVAVGFFGRAYFSAHPDLAADVAANPERVFIELALVLFSPWLAGMLLAAVLAAIMSTLSAQLLVCSSALTQDLYKPLLRRPASDRELVWFGRATVLGVTLVAIALAADPNSRVLGMVSYAWAGFGAAFGPVVLLSLRWRRMTARGALAGMVAGAVTVVVWKQGGWWGLYEIVPGFALATLAILIVSWLDRQPEPGVLAAFDEVQRQLRATAAAGARSLPR